MSISSGNDTKFEYLALLDPKLWTNNCSATDSQKAPSEVSNNMVCRIQVKSKTLFTSKC